MIYSRLFILSILLSLSELTGAQTVKKNFIYGVCGHPFTQESYSKNIDLQINLIKNISRNFYRFDVPIDSNGIVANEPLFLEAIKKMKKNRIKLLPVLIFNTDDYKEGGDSYKRGLRFGRNFVKTYKQYFDYYEVGNEEDNRIILGPNVAGVEVKDYREEKAKVIIPYIKGICESIRKEDASSKIIINAGWIHYGFFQLLELYKVPYNIIGCHWYSDMGDIKNVNGKFADFPELLYKKFGKRIWVTEINIRNGSSLQLSNTNDIWFKRNLNFIRYSRYIDALFIYELLDEPAFANKNSAYYNLGESTYGLWSWTREYTRVQPKALFNRYKLFIKQHP